VSEFLGGVLSSLVAALIWHLVTRNISLSLPPYPDIKGKWEGWAGDHHSNKIFYQETFEFKQQFWCWCQGEFTWTNPKDRNESITYEFLAKFVSSDTILAQFKSKEKRCMDKGAFMIKLCTNTKTGIGAAFSIDFKDDSPKATTYSIRRL
jgi:hypothetical protein